MKTLAGALIVAVLSQAPVPQIPFDGNVDFLKLPPGMNFGEVAGIALNSQGHFFIYDRSRITRLLEFNKLGAFVREIGKDLYGFEYAHVVRVDKDDNIWCVDEGANVVVKFNPAGRVVMVLGRKWEAVEGRPVQEEAAKAPARTNAFNRPTDVTWDPAGNIFVSDGYFNSRVAKYDKNGRFIKSIGIRGTEPYQFNTPHSITADANGNIYVADRNNRRIQVFDSNLVLRAIYDNVGAPWAVCISPGPHQYLFSSNSNPDNNNSLLAAVAGEIYKMELDGTVIGKFGKPGKQLGEFSTVHAIDCRNPDELIVAEITAWRTQKIRLKAITPSSTR